MAKGKRRQPVRIKGKGAFNPDDASNVKHSKVGVWDLYEEVQAKPKWMPWGEKLEELYEMKQNIPFLWRMIRDIGSLRSCWFLLFSYAVLSSFLAVLPAVALW